MLFEGVFTALVTPFKDDQVDEEAYRGHIERQIEKGVNGLVPCGTTGESATLSHAEHENVIRICLEQNKGRVPVLAGAGSNNTAEAISLAKSAQKAGADGILLITPYYNKPTQKGLVDHFKAVAKAVSVPVILYNVPSRTSTNLLPKTIAEIRRACPNVVGIKEATANMIQLSEVLEYCGRDFQLVSGDDFTVLPTLALGGIGVISVVSNCIPDRMRDLIDQFKAGNIEKSRDIHYAMQPLCRASFVESNPAPVKFILSLMGHMKPDVRLPLVTLEKESQEIVRQAARQAGLI